LPLIRFPIGTPESAGGPSTVAPLDAAASVAVTVAFVTTWLTDRRLPSTSVTVYVPSLLPAPVIVNEPVKNGVPNGPVSVQFWPSVR
jgi:hypothetical protein